LSASIFLVESRVRIVEPHHDHAACALLLDGEAGHSDSSRRRCESTHCGNVSVTITVPGAFARTRSRPSTEPLMACRMKLPRYRSATWRRALVRSSDAAPSRAPADIRLIARWIRAYRRRRIILIPPQPVKEDGNTGLERREQTEPTLGKMQIRRPASSLKLMSAAAALHHRLVPGHRQHLARVSSRPRVPRRALAGAEFRSSVAGPALPTTARSPLWNGAPSNSVESSRARNCVHGHRRSESVESASMTSSRIPLPSDPGQRQCLPIDIVNFLSTACGRHSTYPHQQAG